jgi:hypothetical protein
MDDFQKKYKMPDVAEEMDFEATPPGSSRSRRSKPAEDVEMEIDGDSDLEIISHK